MPEAVRGSASVTSIRFGLRWPSTQRFESTPAWRSTSATRKAPGSADQTRTQMACFGSPSRKGPTSRSTRQETSRPWGPRRRRLGPRNAKLRFSRKALFAGRLFPLLRCSNLRADEIPDFRAARFRDVPLDRLEFSSQAGTCNRSTRRTGEVRPRKLASASGILSRRELV